MLDSTPSYRALLAVDIQSSAGRGDPALMDNRQVLLTTLREVLTEAGVPWAACHRDGTGDGLQLVAGPDVWKAQLIHPVVPVLAARLRAHNRSVGSRRAIRVRMALHAGDVRMEDGEVVGGALEDLTRLLDAPPVRRALASAPPSATVALVVSEHYHRETVRHDYPGIEPDTFQRFTFSLKETTSSGWIHLPGYTVVGAVLDDDPDKPRPHDNTGQSISGRYMNIAQGNARVGHQVGRIDTRTGNGLDQPDDVVRRQLAELRRALEEHLASGDLDRTTYEEAEADLRAADSHLGTEPGRVVIALKRLKVLVEEVSELAAKVAAAISAVRGN